MVQRIKSLCKGKGITIAELERRCGIGNGIIARWKTSKPSYERLAKVAKELETTVEYLQTGEEQKEKPIPVFEDGLDDQERQLMELMKELTADQKEFLLAQLLTLTGQGK